MQVLTGYVFLACGMALAIGQALALWRGLFPKPPAKPKDGPQLDSVVDFVKVFVDKLPSAAVALAFAWFGAYVLGWSVGPPK